MLMRYKDTALLLPAGGLPATGSGAGFLILDDQVAAQLDVSQALVTSGVFVFFHGVDNESLARQFVLLAKGFLSQPGHASVKLAWFASLQSSPVLLGATVQVERTSDGIHRLSQGALLAFANWRILLGGAGTLSVSNDGKGLQITSATTANQLTVVPSGGQSSTIAFKGPITLSVDDPILGGCLSAPLELDAEGIAGLDMGLRWYSDSVLNGKRLPFLSSVRYDLFALTSTETLLVDARIDPLAPFPVTRTQVTPAGGQTHASTFLTPVGGTLNITPDQRATFVPALVLTTAPPEGQDTPQVPTSDQPQVYTLIPSGTYRLAPVAPGPGLVCGAVMAGLSGVEYFRGSSDAGDGLSITFHPGQPGYVPARPNAHATTYEAPSDWVLTSWASVCATDGQGSASYYSQPQAGMLYGDAVPGVQGLLYTELTAGITGGAYPAVFPLIPYSGLAAGTLGQAAAMQIEAQVLSPLRRSAIALPTQASPHPVSAVNSQGMLVTAEAAQAGLQSLTLAVTQAGPLRLAPVEGPLLSALMSNQLFIVATDPQAMHGIAQLPFALQIAQWSFELDPAQWLSQGTVLVLKFQNETLASLAANPVSWADAQHFNTDVGTVAQRLSDIISLARTKAESDADMHDFITQVVDNPGWNGVLAFNVPMPVAGWPQAMQGLAAGLPSNGLAAHHVGVLVNATQQMQGNLQLSSSTVFGLLDYHNASPVLNTAADYDFAVETLRIVFRNSAVASFSSTVLLQISQLFSDNVQFQDPALKVPNTARLIGIYQKPASGAGPGAYEFSSIQPIDMQVVSGAVQTLQVGRIQMFSQPDPAQPATGSLSRFTLKGVMALRQATGLDLYSYGGVKGSGLVFDNLAIDMRFALATPTNRIFALNASQIQLNAQASTVRPGSFVANFPMKLSRLLAGSGAPGDMGYMSVDLPIEGTALVGDWWGLEFTLDLGGLGALADAAGLVGTLLIGWNPGSSAAGFVGLGVPGVKVGNQAITLEEVLTLSFGTVQLLPIGGELAGTGLVGPPSGYMLALRNIALKLLSLTFPPSGQVTLLIFGNPTAGAGGTLGWMAAYDKES